MAKAHPLATLEDLKPAAYNPRTISARAAKGLGASLETFGDLSGIVWNKRTGNLAAGHQRVEQLRARGGRLVVGKGSASVEVAVPGVAGAPAAVERFAVRIVDWPLDREKAANIAANNPAIAGEFSEGLEALLGEVGASLGADAFASLGFGDLALDMGFGRKGKTDDDAIPPLPETSVIRPGDLFLLGEHRLLCGDSTKAADVERVMGGRRAGLMNTDPPYGVTYTNDERPNPGVAKARVANDTLTDAALQAFLEAAFRAATSQALSPKAAWYLWHAHLTQGFFAAAAAAAAADVVLHRQIIWVKPSLLLTRGQYHWKHEPCFMGWVQGHQPPDYGRGHGERDQDTVWEIAGVSNAERALLKHSTPKPVALFEIPIVKHLLPGEVCFEPFAGSGPQVIAAEKLARVCCALELSPVFVEVIVRRWEIFTGKTATLESGETLADLATTRAPA